MMCVGGQVKYKSSRHYIFFWVGNLIFRRAKPPQKTDRLCQTKRGQFFDTMRIAPPPIVAILQLISSSAGRSIVKSTTVSARTI